MKKIGINVIVFLVLVCCKAQDKEQTDIMAYCNDAIYVNNLQISTECNKKNPDTYTRADIVDAIDVPLMKEIDKPADEDTGGASETYQSYMFENPPQKGDVIFEVYDRKIPEVYISHPDVTVRLGNNSFRVGDSESKLESALKNGFNRTKNGGIFIYFDFNVLSFSIKEDKIYSISFRGNYFF